MQQFTSQNVKTRTSLLLFTKGGGTPLVLYFENPEKVYQEIQMILNTASATPKLYEYEAIGPIKKVTFVSNQISMVALQTEQYMQ